MRMREGIEARKPRYRASCPSVSGEPTRRRRLYNFFPTIAIIRRRTLLLTAYTSCDTAKNRPSVRREAEASGISGLPAKRPTQGGAEHQFWSSSRRFDFAHGDRHSRVPLWPCIALRTRLGASRFETRSAGRPSTPRSPGLPETGTRTANWHGLCRLPPRHLLWVGKAYGVARSCPGGLVP
jgi:hypothetical protein